jgi:type II secretion system protein G
MRIPENLRSPEERERRRARARARREAERHEERVSVSEALAEKRPMIMVFLLVLMIAVGGMLAGRSVVTVKPVQTHDPAAVARRNLAVLRVALERFRIDCRRYPLTGEGLHALVSDRGYIGWRGRYVNQVRGDPWMNPYVYRSDGQTLSLFSRGPDGVSGTGDDIEAPEPSPQEVAGPFGDWGEGATAASNARPVSTQAYSVSIGQGAAPEEPQGDSVVLPQHGTNDAPNVE